LLHEGNILQMLEEHEVFSRQPETVEQNLDLVLLTMGQLRASLLGRSARLEDGVFSGWAVCLPIFKQHGNYTELMRARRAEWFGGVSRETGQIRAEQFFTSGLLVLELHELEAIVTSDDAVYRVEPYLGELGLGA
jgi:hypothetical protein